ncbi:Uncharacterised protein [Klebsiella pneumoniae]|nr:Uncharacterised protein [Klebsiella pneumoniae]
MIPVVIKRIHDIINGSSNQHDIDIRKLITVADVVILICHIAPTNKRNLIISNKALVMHTTIDTF